MEETARWPIGSAVPCWYDPANPTDVVVIPGFGGAYFFLLAPLALLFYGVMAIRKPHKYNCGFSLRGARRADR